MKNRHKKAFSIIEVLVAFFILTAGILVIYSTTRLPLRHASEARYKITAFYLAHEGIELTRNIRDNNFYTEGVGWLNNIPTSNCFIIDYLGNSEADCDQGSLYFNSGTGYSHNDTGDETKFKRVIEILESTDDIFSITSTVSWGDKENEKIVIYQDFHNYMDKQI
ncbi:MAG: prepilin-type N-terminal cleavage/methylation domain-containing protein [Candidatus Pacebacteria bacterium]|nr:prepilin-type N-terminal cleavage/methylation domain-containing protein [Candidatus Paceibacterota bacterium]